ncbi:hypothetical protein NA57DRAFT_35382 [Rhizodiscina lignyota]|uniref:Uncharacterized protein n=1 Tax=Rhizodiscina lignyota TaxID=1504668 RepID=A0A9P4IJE9_9PEZI|nr:hypothetical protein NA57DRAFT_35382 [Rhizodiscina lignyota]
MAFQQTQHRPQSSRQIPIPQPETQLDTTVAPQLQRKRTLDETEEWILFSPQAPSTTDKTHTTSTDRTPRTAGLSRLSDFGSLDTAARSDQIGERQEEDDNITCQGTEIEDDAELDSLDDGLHAFHEPSEYGGRQRLDDSGGTVLPTHDGLGTFQASSTLVQNQLWQFERYNPRRTKHRRRSSVQRQLDRLDEGPDFGVDTEKMRRIEKWRVEQSIALLEEIERETRRMRRMSRATIARSRADSIASETKTQESSMPGSYPEVVQEAPQPVQEEAAEQESFWTRFTQRVIRDLMGIDETILSVIFGEELPPEAKIEPAEDVSTKAEPIMDLEKNNAGEVPYEPWQHRVIERIARELGILVHQLSEHPGAFSTYMRTQEAPAYAGLPNISTVIIPEHATEDIISPNPTTPGGFTSLSSPATPGTAGPNVYFAPTVPHHRTNSYSEASLWGIEEEPDDEEDEPIPGVTDEAARLRQEKEYWERELDVKMVFNFLKQRFSSRPTSPEPVGRPRPSIHSGNGKAPAAAAGASTPITSARRAAMIRQHHPLVGSSSGDASKQQSKRRELLHRQHQYGIPQHMRSGSGRFSGSGRSRSASVASQTSTKKSKRSLSGSSQRSRNFWDAGAGGSQVGSASGVGVWGEA